MYIYEYILNAYVYISFIERMYIYAHMHAYYNLYGFPWISVRMYLYIYMYKHIYVGLCICTCMYVYVYVCDCPHVCKCNNNCIFACHVCIRIHVCMSMYVYAVYFVCVFVHVHMPRCTHLHMVFYNYAALIWTRQQKSKPRDHAYCSVGPVLNDKLPSHDVCGMATTHMDISCIPCAQAHLCAPRACACARVRMRSVTCSSPTRPPPLG